MSRSKSLNPSVTLCYSRPIGRIMKDTYIPSERRKEKSTHKAFISSLFGFINLSGSQMVLCLRASAISFTAVSHGWFFRTENLKHRPFFGHFLSSTIRSTSFMGT